MEVTDSLDQCIQRLREARKKKEVLSLGYHGNVVDLWERLVHELDTTEELLVDLGSDQTSCHNPFNGGYYPVQLGFTEAQRLMASNPAEFKGLVQERWGRPRAAEGRGTARPSGRDSPPPPPTMKGCPLVQQWPAAGHWAGL
ncbi:urocanate hydratase-like [Marmota marmota marmota]|uniref:urocanate hydratase-like n=1 Tax=Marmota marmota marmota TaxID=9994 RepID=UPI000762B9E0|nr:urocanate hydratase-like [Marmota marmota marmota]